MTAKSIHPVLRRLRDEASARGVPQGVASRASDAVVRWASRQQRLDGRRVRDYYWGTVRRLAFEGADDVRELRRRYVVASLVEDLRGAGMDEARIRDEVVRFYGAEAAATCCAA